MFKAFIVISFLALELFAQNTLSNKKEKYTFNIMSHQENYLLFGGHSSSDILQKHWDDNGNRDMTKDYIRDSNEVQFQISVKLPLYSNFLGTKADLFTAYTQNSYWQAYNRNNSSPFRETNYKPELFLEWQPDLALGNTKLQKVRLSLIHQSNGKSIGASRSWNRTQLHLLFQNENLLYGLDIWDRWDEDQKDSPADVRGDDNPDLEKYIGKQKYFISYQTDDYKITLAHQNNIFDYSLSKGNTKLDLVLPSMSNNFDFFIRYFNGYGESLIDYNVKINRVSFGIILAQWN
jgi:phospholipase A1